MPSSEGAPDRDTRLAVGYLFRALKLLESSEQAAAAMIIEGAIRMLASEALPPFWVHEAGFVPEPDVATGRDAQVALIVSDFRERFGGGATEAALLQLVAFNRLGHDDQAHRLVAAAVMLSRP